MKKPLTFDNFHKGIEDYDYDGYVRMIGLYPYDPIGVAGTVMKPDFDIGGYSISMYTSPSFGYSNTWGSPVKVLSDGSTDHLVYTGKILSPSGGAFYSTTPSGTIIDCILYKGYYMYITSGGLFFQSKGFGTTPISISTYTFSSSARMFTNLLGTVFILDNNYIHIFQGFSNNIAFNPTNPATYTLTLEALDGSLNNEQFISSASNNLYSLFGTQKGNVYAYNTASGSLTFESVVHISDQPISILFESCNKIYAITKGLGLIQIIPSTITEYVILKNSTSDSRMPLFTGSPIAGYITDKFYVFWYNSGGQDDPKTVNYYDSGVLPTGVYAFTNPALFNGKEIGRFCLSALDPNLDTTNSINAGVKSFTKSTNGWLALNNSTSINDTALGFSSQPLRYAIYTNRTSDVYGGLYPYKYNSQFDTAVIGIGTPDAKEKLENLNMVFNGNGCPFRMLYRTDNNGDAWNNLYNQLQGADTNGYIDMSGLGYFVQNLNMKEEVNIQFRVEFKSVTGGAPPRGVKLDSITVE